MPRPIPTVTRALLVANVIVFGLQWFTGSLLELNFALWPPADVQYPGAGHLQVWQPITYAFLHGNLRTSSSTCSRSTCSAAMSSSCSVSRRYTIYYFACVLGAAVAQLFVTSRLDGPARIRRSAHPAACSACCSRSACTSRNAASCCCSRRSRCRRGCSCTALRRARARPRRHRHRRRRRALRAPRRHGRRVRTSDKLGMEGPSALIGGCGSMEQIRG